MNDTVSATPKKMSVKTIAVIGVLTAVTCILAPLSIPIGDVPISLTNLVIYFGLYILGTRRETVSYIVYLLIGLVGVPVFSGFTAGPAKMFGPTGGYLIGFIPMAVIAGIFIEKSGRKLVLGMIGMILGTAVCYIFGTVWFVLVMKTSVQAALTMCVYPFIVFDIIKMVLAAMDRTADSRTSGAGGTFIKSLLFIGYSGKGARNIPFFTCNVFLNVIK